MNFDVRLYQQADREEVFRIAADTAFFGEPVEIFLEDRRLFCDAFCASYLDLEAGHCWVAQADGEVAGFLLGCTDTQTHDRLWARRYLPGLFGRALSGVYRVGKRTRQYALDMAAAYLRGEIPQPDLRTYPAHLHINVDARWRGNGLGSCLIRAYIDQLRGLHIPGVHLSTTDQNKIACRLYEKSGFRLLDSRITRLWQHFVPGPVEHRWYGLVL